MSTKRLDIRLSHGFYGANSSARYQRLYRWRTNRCKHPVVIPLPCHPGSGACGPWLTQHSWFCNNTSNPRLNWQEHCVNVVSKYLAEILLGGRISTLGIARSLLHELILLKLVLKHDFVWSTDGFANKSLVHILSCLGFPHPQSWATNWSANISITHCTYYINQ